MRLNKELRKQIENALIEKQFGPKRKKLTRRFENFADEIYRHAHPPKTRELMDSLPEGFLATTDRVPTHFTGLMRVHLRMTTARRFAAIDAHRAQEYAKDTPQWRKFNALTQARRALGDTEDETRREIRAVLHSVTTVKKLLEVWPEASPYVPTETAPQLPAVSTEALNKALGL